MNVRVKREAMGAALLVATLLAIRFVLANWASRTQRVSRNIFLLALGRNHPLLHWSLLLLTLLLGYVVSGGGFG